MAQAHKPVRILIVDDNEIMRSALSDWLSVFGGVDVIAQAASGVEALACCSESQPDLVLTDVEMPGMSGFDLARRVRESENAPRVVIMSASESPGYGDLARWSGADVFIPKHMLYDLLALYLRTEFGASSTNVAGSS